METRPRNVIVTGAGGGIGGAAVRLIAARPNVNITAVDQDTQALERLASSLAGPAEVVTITADVASPADVQTVIRGTVERWGGLDGIYNIAGISGRPVPITDFSDEEYDKVMAINARSVWLGMKYALPHLVERGQGAIVNTGSYLAIRGDPSFVAYSASKHAVVGMTKSVALAYAKRNVRANVVLPGATDTAMIRQAFDGYEPEDHAAGERTLLALLPSGRMGQPEEIASVGMWALLDAPMYLSGQVLPVDGAHSAG